MTYQTDSDGNFFVGSSLDNSGFNFVTDLPDCLTAALGADNYAVRMPNATAASEVYNFASMRLEWRPQGVGETLTGAITLNTPTSSQYYNESNTGTTNNILSSNARFGIKPFDNSSSFPTQTPMRNIAGQYINILPNDSTSSAVSAGDTAKVYATITQQEVILYITRPDYGQYFLGYQGVVQNIASPFSGGFPKGSVGFSISNAYGNPSFGGFSIWTDSTARKLRFNSFAVGCTTASGRTFGTNLWMTDFPFMFNASSNNHPIIGTAKNLKLAVGTGVVVGNIYQPSTPIDGGSNLWLCISTYPSITNGRIMMRIRT